MKNSALVIISASALTVLTACSEVDFKANTSNPFLSGTAGLTEQLNNLNTSGPSANFPPVGPPTTGPGSTVPGSEPTNAGVPIDPTCPSNYVEAISGPIRLLFVVDSSGSNVRYTTGTSTKDCDPKKNSDCVPPTDPDKTFRSGTMTKFLADYRHKTNFNWQLSSFGDDQARAYIFDSSKRAEFTSDPNRMSTALTSFENSPDVGSTPYGRGLRLAAEAIASDPDRNAAIKPKYFVILISDGFPSDYGDIGSGQFSSDALMAQVDKVVQASPGQVSLSTVFYGQEMNPYAIKLLHAMSTAGNGQFANVHVQSPSFKIEYVIPGSLAGCN